MAVSSRLRCTGRTPTRLATDFAVWTLTAAALRWMKRTWWRTPPGLRAMPPALTFSTASWRGAAFCHFSINRSIFYFMSVYIEVILDQQNILKKNAHSPTHAYKCWHMIIKKQGFSTCFVDAHAHSLIMHYIHTLAHNHKIKGLTYFLLHLVVHMHPHMHTRTVIKKQGLTYHLLWWCTCTHTCIHVQS